MELHRGMSLAMLVGALLGCDAATQQHMLEEHRARVALAFEALSRLGTFIDQCIVPAAEPASTDSPS
jgi:hypothetical protein